MLRCGEFGVSAYFIMVEFDQLIMIVGRGGIVDDENPKLALGKV